MKPTLRATGAVLLWTFTSILVAVAPIIILAVLGHTIALDKSTAKSLSHLALGLASLFSAWKLADRYLATPLRPLIGSTDSLRYYGPWILPASLGLAAFGVGIAVLLHRYVPGFGTTPDIELKGLAGFLAATILAPLAEELVFRGVILRILLTGGHRPFTAIAISATLFALLHAYPVRFIHTFALGLLWGWLAWRTRSLWPGLVGHFTLNALLLALPEPGPIGQLPAATLLLLGGVTTAAGLYGLRRANQIADSASYSTPILPPRSPMIVE